MPEVTISDLGGRGDGIAQTPAGPLYVAYAAPGDRLRVTEAPVRAGVRRARIDEILAAGPDRRDPACGHFGDCGGCSVQHIAVARYQAWKRGLLISALQRRGLDRVSVGELSMSPPAGRRRARFAARRRRGAVSLGFNAARSHRIVPLDGCPVLRPAIVAALPALRALLAALPWQSKATDVQVTETEDGLDIWLTDIVAEELQARTAIAAAADAADWARVAAGPAADVVLTRRTPRLTFSGVAAVPPVGGFLQATREGEASLVGEVLAAAAGVSHVADLFAGIGAFSFALAHEAQVAAVDVDAGAVAALSTAANAARGLKRITVERRDLQRRPLSAAELAGFDAVLFDPPRAGARAQATEVAGSGVPLVLAVSCNPATFARDARVLTDAGYRLERVAPVDQFLWTSHLELVAVFRR